MKYKLIAVAIGALTVSEMTGALSVHPLASQQANGAPFFNRKMTSVEEFQPDVSDVELITRVRDELYKDRTLSFGAQNVKIQAQGGHVTLQGKVRSVEEKIVVEQTTDRVSGVNSISNEIDVPR